MKYPVGPAKFRFVREYQTLRFYVRLNQGQSAVASLSFPFDFIVTGLSASCFVNGAQVAGYVIDRLVDPPFLTQMRLHQNLLDATPVPLRAAWGTGRRPAWLSIPLACRQGWQMSVDTQAVNPTGGAVPITGDVTVMYVLHGYIPSPEEMKDCERSAEMRAKRAYQTYTIATSAELTSPTTQNNGTFPSDGQAKIDLSADFDQDFVVQKINGICFDTTNLDALNYGGPTTIKPAASVQFNNRHGNFNDLPIPFEDAVGDAEFPHVLKPALLIRSGDFVKIGYIDQTNSITTRPYVTLVGYVPNEAEIHRLLVNTGRVLPAFYDPQSARPGRARPGIKPGTVVR